MFKPLTSRYSSITRGAIFRRPLDAEYASISLTIPSLNLIADTGGIIALTVPALLLEASGNDDNNVFVELRIPDLELTIRTGAQVAMVLPALSLEAGATNLGFATVALELPKLALAATAKTGAFAIVDLTLPELALTAQTGAYASLELLAPQLVATATSINLGSAALTLPFMSLLSTATTGMVATAILEMPIAELVATGLTGERATASLVFPALLLSATSDQTITESTYCVNLTTGAVTQLLLGEFDKLVTAHGRLYGLQGDALMVLEGGTDDGVAIPATVRFAPQTFGMNRAQRMSTVYLSSREDDGFTLTVVADETRTWTYQTPTDTAPAYGTHKIRVGRGVKFHTAGLIVQNRNGGPMELGGLEVLVDTGSPRPKS